MGIEHGETYEAAEKAYGAPGFDEMVERRMGQFMKEHNGDVKAASEQLAHWMRSLIVELASPDVVTELDRRAAEETSRMSKDVVEGELEQARE